MNKKKNFLIIIIIIFFLDICNSKEVSNVLIVSIDNAIITQLELYKEINFTKFITNSEDSIDLNYIKNESLHSLIDRKIKILETDNYKIEVSEKDIEVGIYNYLKDKKKTIEDLNIFYKKYEVEEDYLKNIIKTEMRWSKLIRGLYENRLNINLTEIDKELIKENKNSSDNETLKKQLIISEQNILMNKFAASHLDKSKKKYLIKLL
jgi:hypothetical protein